MVIIIRNGLGDLNEAVCSSLSVNTLENVMNFLILLQARVWIFPTSHQVKFDSHFRVGITYKFDIIILEWWTTYKSTFINGHYKMFHPLRISLQRHLGCQGINLALLSRYCLRGRPSRTRQSANNGPLGTKTKRTLLKDKY